VKDYQHILLAVDLSDGSRDVGLRARDMAARYSARMSVMHVVEYLPVEPMGEALLPAINMEDELVKTARRRLDNLVEELGVDLVQHQVVVGNIKAEIVNYARENAVDLIVLGSHERHGLSVLVNLAEDTVLHASPCDVLAVRIRD